VTRTLSDLHLANVIVRGRADLKQPHLQSIGNLVAPGPQRGCENRSEAVRRDLWRAV